MALYDRPLVAFSLRVFATLLLLLALALVSSVGGVLNRCRGGYLNMDLLTYWPKHDISREVFSIPTGLLVVSECCRITGVVTRFCLQRLLAQRQLQTETIGACVRA